MEIIYDLHNFFNAQRRFHFPFDNQIREIPNNGIYIIFEKDERYKTWDRIVRVGTHTGNNQLRSRLKQHFTNENKNRSIFRKNIGRCILNRDKDPYLMNWEFDSTSKADKEKNIGQINKDFEKQIERQISNYVQTNLSFTVFELTTKDERLFWESRLISTLSKTTDFKPTSNWFGNHSPKDKIRKYGLWQVNELTKEPLTDTEWSELKRIIENTRK